MSKNNYSPIWVSQNFLTSSKTIRRLINKTSINPRDHVIEIGPGKGHITAQLLQYCQKVSAIELDKVLCEKLRIKYEKSDNLKLYNMDFLKWNLPAEGTYKIFANIPFCHTTDIIRKLVYSLNPPTEAWLIIEKGAAKRLMGTPSENKLSLNLKPLFEMNVIYHFKGDDFHPKPKVDIVMLHIKRKIKSDITKLEWRSYQNFIDNAIRNKGNGLRHIFTKRQLLKAFSAAGLNDSTSGEILYIQWLCLFRCYSMFK